MTADAASSSHPAPAVRSSAPAASPAPRRRIEEVLEAARSGHRQIPPAELAALIDSGDAVAIDIRSAVTRDPEGHIPGAVVVERLVLEWRLDPQSAFRMDDGPGYDDLVVVVCNEGYSSSLAARDLRALGFSRATDLAGGFRAWFGSGLPVADRPTRYVD